MENNNMSFQFVDRFGSKPTNGTKAYVKLSNVKNAVNMMGSKDITKMIEDLGLVEEHFSGLENVYSFKEPFDKIKVDLLNKGIKRG